MSKGANEGESTPSAGEPRLDDSVASQADDIRRGNRRAMAQAITLLESRRPEQAAMGQAILDRLLPLSGQALRVGITGPPGVGKSTFIEGLGLMLSLIHI